MPASAVRARQRENKVRGGSASSRMDSAGNKGRERKVTESGAVAAECLGKGENRRSEVLWEQCRARLALGDASDELMYF